MIPLLQVAVVLALSRAMRGVFARLGQPPVIGEMVAGLMLGPSLFGWLLPSGFAALFPPDSLPPLNALSQVGLVLFMFLVGVRVRAKQLAVNRSVAVAVSGVSIVVPFLMGGLLAARMHDHLAPAGVAVLPFALFIGTAMSITAFPVLARILADHGLLTTEIGLIALTCAAFNDVTGWLILAGVTALVRGDDMLGYVAQTLLLFGYLAVMLGVVRPGLRAYAGRRGPQLGSSSDDLALVLLVMLASALATEALGVHALFGAFFAGLMLPRAAQIEPMLSARVEPLVMTLLLPLFFAVAGLRTNVQLIDSTAMWLDAAAIVAVAVVAKGGASALAARVMGLEWRDAAALGALLNARGLVELVILNIGLEIGILSPLAYSIMVMMALITTFMTSPLLTLLWQGDAAGAGGRSADIDPVHDGADRSRS